MRSCNFERVERRIHNAHVPAARANLLQVAVAARNAEHVAKRGEDHVRSRGERQRLVDLLEWCHTHRAARSVNHLDRAVEQLVDALPYDGVSLAAADLHQGPRTSCRPFDALD